MTALIQIKILKYLIIWTVREQNNFDSADPLTHMYRTYVAAGVSPLLPVHSLETLR